MSLSERVTRGIAYAWAAPNTALGTVAGLLMLALGGRLRIIAGTVEFSGGWLGRSFRRLPTPFRFSAMTLGHVILGVNESVLATCREHELVHVRQYERWGIFFLPAYLLSSAWEWAHGRRAYRDNYFEREAFADDGRCDPRRLGDSSNPL